MDWKRAGLGERRESMLAYVEKLTVRPSSLEHEDFERLRRAGFEDEDVLAICEVTAYYAYANRMADGLGVQLEE